jgi:hypothetical protein
MTTDFEADLRAKLAGINPSLPSGLAQEVVESHRRHQKSRRRTTMAATGGAAAVVGVVAGLSLTNSPAPATATTPTTTTTTTTTTAAYVVDHVTSALSSTNAITEAIDYITGTQGNATVYTWAYGNQTRSLGETPPGKPNFDIFATTTGNKVTSVYVKYPTRTWDTITESQSSTPTDGCHGALSPDPTIDTVGLSPEAWKSAILADLKCGSFSVVTHQQVDGVDAIGLEDHQIAQPTTLWIDPETYLPVELTTPKEGGAVAQKTDFQWLAPTKANLANLTVSIPSGFKQTTPATQIGALPPAKPAS